MNAEDQKLMDQYRVRVEGKTEQECEDMTEEERDRYVAAGEAELERLEQLHEQREQEMLKQQEEYLAQYERDIAKQTQLHKQTEQEMLKQQEQYLAQYERDMAKQTKLHKQREQEVLKQQQQYLAQYERDMAKQRAGRQNVRLNANNCEGDLDMTKQERVAKKSSSCTII